MILVSADGYQHDPFDLFEKVVSIDDMKLSDLDSEKHVVIFWGGTDIPPKLYGERNNSYVYVTSESTRDLKEIALFKYCVKHDIAMIGICRGAQLICALTGGKLIQHIHGHDNSHYVTLHDEEDARVICNSSHHQMMVPSADAKILATAKETQGFSQHNQRVSLDAVNEVVAWPQYKALGIQPHPEWKNCSQVFIDYCIRKIKEYVL